MAPSAEKQAGKLLGLLAEEGREYGDLVAERLVDLVRSQPRESRDDLHRQLVSGAAAYLSHTAWYARVAAASCLESLARLEYAQEQSSSSPSGEQEEEGGGDSLTDELARGWVRLGDVRLAEVLERGALLLSHGEHADAIGSQHTENAPADVGTRVGRQRKRLLRCLGLAGGSGEARAGSLYSSIGDAIEDDDLKGPAAASKTMKRAAKGGGRRRNDTSPYPVAPVSGKGKHAAYAGDGGGSEDGTGARQKGQPQLSARQRNRLAREARSDAAAASGSGASGKRRRRDAVGGGDGSGGGGQEGRDDGPPAFLGRGPKGGMMDVASNARETLVSLAADLVAQLFHPIWQCRHGAALGALSILRAWNARRRRGELVPYGNRMAAWAEDAVARCVCVLALDRFGDYSGRMVAPVRETAAQLFAVAALQLDADGLKRAAALLSELTSAEEWQARHGGFCGLESISAVAIAGDGADGRGAPSREVAASLRDLVYRAAAPGGLSDPAEDVCAAAARAVRIVMRRFLSPIEALEMPDLRNNKRAGQSDNGGGGGAVESGVAAASAGGQVPRVFKGASGFAGGREEGTTGRGVDGEEVFDLVWNVLEDLDQESACVEDLADLLETCCEDVGRACGATEAFLSSGEHRLSRILDLWGDRRASVRACAVRSLLALAKGIVGATQEASNAYPTELAGPPPAAAAAAAAAATGRCESLLRRCFAALVSERDDGVRDHFVRLWNELLKGLGSDADDRAGGAHAALTTWCLDLLFTQQLPPPFQGESENIRGMTAGDAAASSADGEASPSSSRGAGRQPSKRSRKENAAKKSAEGLAATATVAARKSPCPDQQQNHPEEGTGATATFFARLAAVEALAELARAAATLPRAAKRGVCDSVSGGSDVIVAAAATSAGNPAAGSRSRQDRSSGERSGHRPDVVDDAGAGAPASRHCGMASINDVDVFTGARELIMSAVVKRAGSAWAWERELAFFLMEACCTGGGCGRGGEGDGATVGKSLPGSGERCLSEAEQGAWAAVDLALATNNRAATTNEKAVFRELEGVDKAVSSACSGVIRALLQDATGAAAAGNGTTGTTHQSACASGGGTSRDSGATADTSAAPVSAPAARKASQRGKTRSPKSMPRGAAKDAAATNDAGAVAASPRASGGKGSSAKVAPALSQSALMVERTFVSLAAAFGETLVPLGRGASRQEREAVWTGRVRHFHARIQEQQAALAKRVASAAASVYATIRPLPSELNPVLRPLVTAVKKEPDAQRRGRSASRLAHLAAALLSDATRSERRDAGAMVLFGLASLAGKGQQQQNLAAAAAAAAAATAALPVAGGVSVVAAADVARDGATETLRHAVALAMSSPSSSAQTRRTTVAPAPSTAPRLASVAGSRSGGGSGGGGNGGEEKEEERDHGHGGYIAEGSGGEGAGGGGEGAGGGCGKAVGDWARRTLAPLLQHPSFTPTSKTGNAAETAAAAPARRKLSAAECKKSPSEIRATELSAALGVADALLQAARDPPVADGDLQRGAVARSQRPLLASLLLDTPLAAGLLALACSGRVPVTSVGGNMDTEVPIEGRRSSARSRRQQGHEQQQEGQRPRQPQGLRHSRNGGSGAVAEDASRGSAVRGVAVDGSAGAAAGAEALLAATADAALAITRDAAATFPRGLWVGIRAELLPALAAGPVSSSGDSGAGGNEVAFGGGIFGVGVTGGVRVGLVLKEVVSGMGTGVVPFAARLLPVALRGMTDANEEFRGLLAGTFNELVKAVALAADGEDDAAPAASASAAAAARAADGHQAGAENGRNNHAKLFSGGPLHGQLATGVGQAARDSIEEDGELIVRHLVRGEPLPRLHRGLLPGPLSRMAAAGVTLRPYQWEGIAWLDFLRRIGAHGILADDMGLGKTLQALMAVAMCHHHNPSGRRSLVVCPSMLVHHWQAECSRYFDSDLLRPVAYAGTTKARRQIAARLGLGVATNGNNSKNVASDNNNEKYNNRGTAAEHTGTWGGEGATATKAAAASATAAGQRGEPERQANVVITSYNVLRTDSDLLGQQRWLYLVLDEAHLLRNPATGTAKAARALRSNHRVGLTGTPIQNSVLELWSLFQFLMPGYLGDRRSFQREVARPVRAALSADGDGKATVEGLRELEKLHRQVLPFVLRREKGEVLADLPPKIITEMLCDLTSEQRRLHDLWERGGDGGRVMAAVAEAEAMETARLRAAAASSAASAAAVAASAAAAETTQSPTEGTTNSIDLSMPRASKPPPALSTARASGGAGGDGAGGGGAGVSRAETVRGTVTPAERLSVGAQTLTCLSKLQLLCVHPSLVSTAASSDHGREQQGERDDDKGRGKGVNDVRLSGKLMALRELLWDAGIGKRSGSLVGGGVGDNDGEASSCAGTDSDDSESDAGSHDATGDVSSSSSSSCGSSEDDEEEDDEEEQEQQEKEQDERKRELSDGQQSSGNRGRQNVMGATNNSRKRGTEDDQDGGRNDVKRPTRTSARRGRSATTRTTITATTRGKTGGDDDGDGDVSIRRSDTRSARKKAGVKLDAAATASAAVTRAGPARRGAAATSTSKAKSTENNPRGMAPSAPPSREKQRCLPHEEEKPATTSTTKTTATRASAASPVLPGCKCLVFAQHKAALDVTESALLRPCFPGVKYLRMDGSVPQAERAAVVDSFSADPSVAILLLTTRVGHLGLNLSAASMVVFLEHDWNPQVDLQAMDRAHRLGQRKAVNVYRLIAANSIEQRVLRLQGHKLDVAGAVVDRDNASAFSSGTGGVLGMLGEAMAVVAAAATRNADGGDSGPKGEGGGGEGVELWSADEDYAYLAAERLADSVARE